MEKVSKNKRGRPRGAVRDDMERHFDRFGAIGCLRTQMDWAYMMHALKTIYHDDEAFQTVMGISEREILSSSSGKYPKGWNMAGVEIGRYLEKSGDTFDNVKTILVDARRRGISFSDIAAHFRQARLGARKGNPEALMSDILRVVSQYKKRFPLTTDEDILDSLRAVTNIIDGSAL